MGVGDQFSPTSSGIEQQRYAFDRARRILFWYIVFSFWYSLWGNPGTMYRKCLIFYSLFFKVFLDFVHEERIEDKKVTSGIDRTRRVVSWYSVFKVWYNQWANPGANYSNPTSRYPTLGNKRIPFQIHQRTSIHKGCKLLPKSGKPQNISNIFLNF